MSTKREVRITALKDKLEDLNILLNNKNDEFKYAAHDFECIEVDLEIATEEMLQSALDCELSDSAYDDFKSIAEDYANEKNDMTDLQSEIDFLKKKIDTVKKNLKRFKK